VWTSQIPFVAALVYGDPSQRSLGEEVQVAKRDVVVIAGSAGGIEALIRVFERLTAEFDAAIFVVLHMPPAGGHALARILDRAGPLPASVAVDGERIQSQRVYVCSGDHHLVLGNGHVHVKGGPRENGHRPAADPLFRSAAAYYGSRVIGVILSGALGDGTAGLLAVRRHGGVAIVQHPEDALYDGMPRNALEYVDANYVAPADEIGPLIERLVAEDVDGTDPEPLTAKEGEEVKEMETELPVPPEDLGSPSPWPCPDCNGVLWSIEEGENFRFRCRVGHAWWPDTLLAQQGAQVEMALWVALRALEDRAALSRTLAERADAGGRSLSAHRFRRELSDIERSIQILRNMVHAEGSGTAPDSEMTVG
jgi:two-component system chemotaxis response regulator CheB